MLQTVAGAFQLRMLGWKNKPADTYLRTFYHEAEKYYHKYPVSTNNSNNNITFPVLRL